MNRVKLPPSTFFSESTPMILNYLQKVNVKFLNELLLLKFQYLSKKQYF